MAVQIGYGPIAPGCRFLNLHDHKISNFSDRIVLEISQRNQRTGSIVLIEYDVPNIEFAAGVEYGRIAAVVR